MERRREKIEKQSEEEEKNAHITTTTPTNENNNKQRHSNENSIWNVFRVAFALSRFLPSLKTNMHDFVCVCANNDTFEIIGEKQKKTSKTDISNNIRYFRIHGNDK